MHCQVKYCNVFVKMIMILLFKYKEVYLLPNLTLQIHFVYYLYVFIIIMNIINY